MLDVVENDELILFIEQNQMMGKGLGFVDVNIDPSIEYSDPFKRGIGKAAEPIFTFFDFVVQLGQRSSVFIHRFFQSLGIDNDKTHRNKYVADGYGNDAQTVYDACYHEILDDLLR